MITETKIKIITVTGIVIGMIAGSVLAYNISKEYTTFGIYGGALAGLVGVLFYFNYRK